MLNNNVFLIAIAITMVVLMLSIGLGSYSEGHINGYKKGISDAKLYQETTGEFPTKDWVEANKSNHFNYPEEILDTLKEYTK